MILLQNIYKAIPYFLKYFRIYSTTNLFFGYKTYLILVKDFIRLNWIFI